MTNGATGWTDERVETLRKLWGEGLSASQIARQLGGVTRNAVIGKVHRLKLSGRVKTSTAAKKAKPAAAAASTHAVRATKTASARPQSTSVGTATIGATALKQDIRIDAVPRPMIVEEADVVVPISRRLSLTQLGERTCKWPIGDPLTDDFHFCGHEPRDGSPYCGYHSRLAFQPASERRRAR